MIRALFRHTETLKSRGGSTRNRIFFSQGSRTRTLPDHQSLLNWRFLESILTSWKVMPYPHSSTAKYFPPKSKYNWRIISDIYKNLLLHVLFRIGERNTNLGITFTEQTNQVDFFMSMVIYQLIINIYIVARIAIVTSFNASVIRPTCEMKTIIYPGPYTECRSGFCISFHKNSFICFPRFKFVSYTIEFVDLPIRKFNISRSCTN